MLKIARGRYCSLTTTTTETITAMAEIQTTITPHSQQPLVSRTYPTEAELDATIERAASAQKQWAKVPLQERIQVGRKFMVRSGHTLSQ